MSPEEFLKRYAATLATQDWQAVDPLVHPDACVTFSNGAQHKGKAAVQAAFEKNFAAIQDEQYSISDVHWVTQAEDHAVCLYTFNWSGLINGEPASGSGRGTSVIIRQGDTWLLLVEHLGPAPKE